MPNNATSVLPDATARSSAITVSGLELTYHDPGEVRALRGIDLEVGRGEIVALVGETGSGKSSLATSILNLIPASAKTRGSVRITLENGEVVEPLTMTPAAARSFRREHVAFVPQLTKRALVPVLSIEDHFRQFIPSKSRQDVRDRATALLDEVGLHDATRVLQSYPHQLSGGMAQRVCIALAMSGSGALVVADEPTSGLDALVKMRVADLLKLSVEHRGSTMLLVTHDLVLVERIATRVAVLYGGCLVEVGPVKDVFENPAHPYTQALLGATPQPGHPLRVLPGTTQRVAGPLEKCVFADRCPIRHERCLSEVPQLRSIGGGREVASWCVQQ